MQNRKFKSLLPSLAAAAMLLFTASCNRGVGCPTNYELDFSLLTPLLELIKCCF